MLGVVAEVMGKADTGFLDLDRKQRLGEQSLSTLEVDEGTAGKPCYSVRVGSTMEWGCREGKSALCARMTGGRKGIDPSMGGAKGVASRLLQPWKLRI